MVILLLLWEGYKSRNNIIFILRMFENNINDDIFGFGFIFECRPGG